MRISQMQLPLVACCILWGGIPIQAATADESRTLEVVLGASVIHDSNVFRLPGFVDPQLAVGVPSKSDTINVASAGLRIDKPYAQQRFQLNVTETAYRYSNFSFLNFDALEYRGAWLWHLTPRWGGTLSAERRKALVSFADTQLFQRNLRTADNYRFSLDGSLFGGWHILFGVFQYQQKYDLVFLAQSGNRTRGGEAGIKYESASGSSLSVIQRSIDGDFLNRVVDATNFIDNAFRQDESELSADWKLSGNSVLNGRLTWVDRRHEHFAERDFSGLTGELGYIWTPTGKLRVDIVAKRDINSWWETFSSYRVDDSLSFTPTWQVSAKTSVRMRLERIKSDFRGPVFPPPGPLRSDIVNSAQLAVDWSPLRSLALGASLQRQWRSSNNPGFEFDASIASVNAKLMF